MAILGTLRKSGGISALSRHLGAGPAETMTVADAVIPELLSDFQNYSGGIDGLLELINAAGGAAMAQAIMSAEPVDSRPGLLLLAKVRASGAVVPGDQATTADADLRQRMLPLLAMLLGGYLAARAMSGGLDMAELATLLEARKSYYSPGEEPV